MDTDKPAHNTDTPRTKRSPHIFDIIALAALGVISLLLIVFIVHRVALKHEVNGARTVSDKVIAAIDSGSASGIRAEGDSSFKQAHSVTQLSSQLQLTKFASIYGRTPPVVERQIVDNNAKRQYVVFIYRYDRLKVPFYIRIDVDKPTGATAWHLQALSGNLDKSQLL